MKKHKLFTPVLLIGFLGAILTSCGKKEGCTDPAATNYDPDAKKNCCCTYPPPVTDIATKITGNYIGSGNSPAGNPFVNKVIKISKVNATRVKIEPVGHSEITAFEINIMEVGTTITQAMSEPDNTIGVVMSNSPYTIGFSTDSPSPTQDFGGTKQ